MQQEGSSRVPWTILLSAVLLCFAMWVPMFCVPPMEHILKAELHLTHAQTSLLYSAPTLMAAVVAIPAGYIADRIGVRKAAGIGAIIMAVGTILRSTATESSSLLAFTFIYGVGLGWSIPNLPKLVAAWIPREKAGVAMGIFTSAMPIGAALAMAITMPLVFPITNTFQGVFLIWSIPPIAAAVLWWILAKEPPHSNIHSEAVNRGATQFRQVFRNKNLWLLSIFMLLGEFFIYTWIGWAPALLMLKEAAPSLAGLIASVTIWAMIPGFLFMPRLSHKLGLRKPFLWLPSIILALVAWGAIHMTLSTSWLLMALAGVAYGIRYVITMTLPVEMLPKEEVGVASGLVCSFGFIAGVIGPWIGGRILDLTGSLDLSLLMLIGLSIATAGIAFRLPETGPKAIAKSSA